jgi:hypothetical protein
MFGSYFLAKMTKANTNRKSGSDRNGPIVEDRSSDYFWWLERNRPVTMKPEGPCTCKYLPVQRLHCNSLREKNSFSSAGDAKMKTNLRNLLAYSAEFSEKL